MLFTELKLSLLNCIGFDKPGKYVILFMYYYIQVDWPVKLQIAHGVIRGMNYLHTKTPSVVHGDLKLQNVLIGDAYVAKVNIDICMLILTYSVTVYNSFCHLSVLLVLEHSISFLKDLFQTVDSQYIVNIFF